MSDVFANGHAIACKAGDGKVIASFPDVCLSPPSPPAGPIPIPYPNTSFSRDMQSGSKTVKIGRKEVMLKDKSYYKTSPLGDEPATRSFGGSVITHTITGKTYFTAWSMDVKFEGENVDRNLDLTTSNHNPYPGSTPPTPDQDDALNRFNAGECPCCGKPGTKCPGAKAHPDDQALTRDEWYFENIMRNPQTGNEKKEEQWKAYEKLVKECDDMTAKKKRGEPTPCTCEGDTKVLPEPPCDLFVYNPDPAIQKARHDAVVTAWDDFKENTGWQNTKGIPRTEPSAKDRAKRRLKREGEVREPTTKEIKNQRQTNHLTPKSAGCASGDGNLQPMKDLCNYCQKLDDQFSKYQ